MNKKSKDWQALKAWRQRRREHILEVSKGKKRGDNLLLYLGGVIQKGKA